MPVVDGALRRYRREEREKLRRIRDPRFESIVERHCAITFKQSRSTGPSGSATTIALAFSGAVTPGSLLTCSCACLDHTITATVADSVNGAWTVSDTITTGPDVQTSAAYFANSAAGTPTVTITFNTSASRRTITIGEFAGVATSTPLDAHTGQSQSATAGTDAMTSGTASCAANDLLIGIFMDQTGGASPSAGTGFTLAESVYDATFAYNLNFEYLLDSGTAGSKAATWTESAGSGQLILQAFKIAGGGGGGAALKRNSSLNGLGSSGPFFHDPLSMPDRGIHAEAA